MGPIFGGMYIILRINCFGNELDIIINQFCSKCHLNNPSSYKLNYDWIFQFHSSLSLTSFKSYFLIEWCFQLIIAVHFSLFTLKNYMLKLVAFISVAATTNCSVLSSITAVKLLYLTLKHRTLEFLTVGTFHSLIVSQILVNLRSLNWLN